MPHSNESQLKLALSEHRAARHKLADFLRPHSSSLRLASVSPQALNELLKSTLASTGFDLNKFDKLRMQGEAEVRDWAAKRRAEDEAQTSVMQKTIQQTIES